MPALSVIDLAMFALETRERPFNIGPLIVLAPPAGFRGNFADKLVARMLKRPLGPPFNYRLVVAPMGVPRLDVDDEADPATHVHRLTLKAPGTLRAACSSACASCTNLASTGRGRSGNSTSSTGSRVARSRSTARCTTASSTVARSCRSSRPGSPRRRSERTVHAMWEGVARTSRASPPRASLAARVQQRAGSGGGNGRVCGFALRRCWVSRG